MMLQELKRQRINKLQKVLQTIADSALLRKREGVFLLRAPAASHSHAGDGSSQRWSIGSQLSENRVDGMNMAAYTQA